MKESERKILKIIDTMYSYCVFIGGTNITVHTISDEKDTDFKIEVETDFEQKYLKKYINKLDKILNGQKDPTMEATYWQLIGNQEFQDDNDLYIVGNMIDKADIKIDEKHLSIVLVKKYA